jgi:hypothetical protein
MYRRIDSFLRTLESMRHSTTMSCGGPSDELELAITRSDPPGRTKVLRPKGDPASCRSADGSGDLNASMFRVDWVVRSDQVSCDDPFVTDQGRSHPQEPEFRPCAAARQLGRHTIRLAASWSNLRGTLQGHQAVPKLLKAPQTFIRGQPPGTEQAIA